MGVKVKFYHAVGGNQRGWHVSCHGVPLIAMRYRRCVIANVCLPKCEALGWRGGGEPPAFAGAPTGVVRWGVAVEGADVAGVAAFEGFGEFGGGGVVACADAGDEHGGGQETR